MKTQNIRRYYLAIIVTAVLIIFAAAGTSFVGINMRGSDRQQFVAAVDVHVGEIESDIKSDKSDTQSIAQSYLIATNQFRAGQADYQPRLKLLYDNISRRDVDLAMVGVAQRVLPADRTSFEQNLSNEISKGISISSMNSTGTMVADVLRQDYFPITFIEPKDEADTHIGMNIGADPIIAKAMRQAAETGFPAVSGTMILHKNDLDENGYCVIAPISSAGQLIGYAIEYDSFSQLIKEISGSQDGFSSLAIFDSAAPVPSQPVTTIGNGFKDGPGLSELIAESANYVKKIDLKNHYWTIVAIPNPADPANVWQMSVIGAANLAFIILIAMYMFSSIRRSLSLESVQADLRKSNEDLSTWAVKSEQRSFELTMLREMTDMLQTCDSSSEAFLVMSLFMYKLFMPFSGAIYMLDINRETAEIKVSWGGDSPADRVIKFDDCIALKRSAVYKVEDTAAGLACAHAKNPTPGGYICLPMMAQGETFGLFYLAAGAENNPRLDTDEYVLATTVTEQLAMTLANITLRERLKELSLTDHLTKLFNRRYMEDMLEREVRRAERNNLPIGFIMFDIDFFKDINDTFGHDAGDRVLETLGIFLKTSVRLEDIACRYGGEEFLLVMPGSDRANTVKRANEILDKVQLLSFETDGKALPPIHLSGGVAIYPEDTNDKQQVVIKADEALYEAKKTGRNKIVVWADIEK
jgi:diguanylate cyclase (GGDEF)-like protein